MQRRHWGRCLINTRLLKVTTPDRGHVAKANRTTQDYSIQDLGKDKTDIFNRSHSDVIGRAFQKELPLT